MREPTKTIIRYGYLFAVACILVATAIFILGRNYFAKEQWALLYLLIIGLVAGLSGVRPALLASVLAFLAWNYFFIPPFKTLQVHDPTDWLSLLVFLIVGIAMGLQTGRMREREAEALAREREMAFLNEFSAHLVSETSISDMVDLLIGEVNRSVGSSCVIVFRPDEPGRIREFESPPNKCRPDHSVTTAAAWAFRESKAIGLPAASGKPQKESGGWPISVPYETAYLDAGRRDLFIPLQTTTNKEGVLYIGERRDGKTYSRRDARLLVAAANQSAAFLERKRLQSIAIQADAIQEADKLKSTLVSSVSHELKTPLASITATVSNLLEQDVVWEADKVHEELEAVQDDLQRLNSSISALFDLSRLETASWAPKKEPYELGEILGTALTKISRVQRERVSFALPEDLPIILVDFQQMARVLQNLIENALAYSPAGSPVRVGATHTSWEITFWVEDEGPGISAEDRSRIFDKFYRGEASATVPSGTGLGLAVTREIVRYHGGKIWVEDVVPHGTRMVISLQKENE